jgi:GTP-binding protein EngB required for normal cell division
VNLAAALAELENAADAATSIGVDASSATAVVAAARERLGFVGSAYVLALVGGTGVGKSTVLNALAGDTVSEAGPRRPTTNGPIAWVATRARTETLPLIRRLGIAEVREHALPGFRDVAILDLPDVDSTAPEHRAQVDELLPRVDAVVWVTDPEKYRDAVLHDGYVRRWAPRLARQIVVLNKMDRVPADRERLRAHLAQSLRDDGAPDVGVALASAREGDVRELRGWIGEGVDAKRVASERLAAEARSAAADLAARAGVAGRVAPIVPDERRTRVLADVTREALALVDLSGLERQAVAATRLAARPRGAGPLGHLTAAIYRATGRDRVAADPEGYLRRWRERGTLSRPAEPVRALIGEILPSVPPEARGAIAALVDMEKLRGRIAAAIDAAVASRTADVRPPTSLVWSVIGVLQYAVTAALLFVGLWIATLFLLHPPVGSVDVPVLGPVPIPLVALAALLLLGYALARTLGAHAGYLGRRWARRLRDDLSREIETRVADAIFGPLAAFDATRVRLASALTAVHANTLADGVG